MKNEVGKRIKAIRLNRGETLEEFGKHFDARKTTVHYWETGRNLPNKRAIKLIADLANISVEELLTGRVTYDANSQEHEHMTIYKQLIDKRKQLVDRYTLNQLSEQKNQVEEVSSSYNNVVSIYGVVSAGGGQAILDNPIEEVEVSSASLPNKPYDLALKVKGDSMTPTFKNDEIVFIEKNNNPKNGAFGVFVINGEAYLKKVYIEDNQLRLVSLNKAYDDMIFNEYDHITYIGSVVL